MDIRVGPYAISYKQRYQLLREIIGLSPDVTLYSTVRNFKPTIQTGGLYLPKRNNRALYGTRHPTAHGEHVRDKLDDQISHPEHTVDDDAVEVGDHFRCTTTSGRRVNELGYRQVKPER